MDRGLREIYPTNSGRQSADGRAKESQEDLHVDGEAPSLQRLYPHCSHCRSWHRQDHHISEGTQYGNREEHRNWSRMEELAFVQQADNMRNNYGVHKDEGELCQMCRHSLGLVRGQHQEDCHVIFELMVLKENRHCSSI